MPLLDKRFIERREAIRKILNTAVIRDQDELQRQLARKGFRVTQSSVSRDLQELKVIKIDGRYALNESLEAASTAIPAPAKVAPGNERSWVEASWIASLTPAGSNLLVVHVPPGRASTLAVALDQLRWPEIVGSIAGDDTIFLATRNRNDLLRVKQRLETIRKEQ